MTATHDRLVAESVEFTIGEDEKSAGHRFTVSLAKDSNGVLREIVFVGRGKSGHGLDMMLQELGIKLSRAIQGRNPDTGERCS